MQLDGCDCRVEPVDVKCGDCSNRKVAGIEIVSGDDMSSYVGREDLVMCDECSYVQHGEIDFACGGRKRRLEELRRILPLLESSTARGDTLPLDAASPLWIEVGCYSDPKSIRALRAVSTSGRSIHRRILAHVVGDATVSLTTRRALAGEFRYHRLLKALGATDSARLKTVLGRISNYEESHFRRNFFGPSIVDDVDPSWCRRFIDESMARMDDP